MRRSETLVALLAVVLASIAATPIKGRLLFAFAAVVLIAWVGGLRLRAALMQKRSVHGFDAAARAARISAGREARSGTRRNPK